MGTPGWRRKACTCPSRHPGRLSVHAAICSPKTPRTRAGSVAQSARAMPGSVPALSSSRCAGRPRRIRERRGCAFRTEVVAQHRSEKRKLDNLPAAAEVPKCLGRGCPGNRSTMLPPLRAFASGAGIAFRIHPCHRPDPCRRVHFEADGLTCRLRVAPSRVHRAEPETYGVTSVDRLGMEVRMTTFARTVADLFDCHDLAGGAEELLNSLDLVTRVDTGALVRHTGARGNATASGPMRFWLEREEACLGVPRWSFSFHSPKAPEIATSSTSRRTNRSTNTLIFIKLQSSFRSTYGASASPICRRAHRHVGRLRRRADSSRPLRADP